MTALKFDVRDQLVVAVALTDRAENVDRTTGGEQQVMSSPRKTFNVGTPNPPGEVAVTGIDLAQCSGQPAEVLGAACWDNVEVEGGDRCASKHSGHTANETTAAACLIARIGQRKSVTAEVARERLVDSRHRVCDQWRKPVDRLMV